MRGAFFRSQSSKKRLNSVKMELWQLACDALARVISFGWGRTLMVDGMEASGTHLAHADIKGRLSALSLLTFFFSVFIKFL